MIMTTLPASNREPMLRFLRVGYRFAMIERWPNYGKLMKATEKPLFSGPCLGWPKVALSAPFSRGQLPARPR
jgi:hypothetical protein